ncbi:hypothetical protein HanXRQr2_Chr11g0479441 [Helianthus annuus]|uniref:Uncharacterized protein n=1 Tax=Helianthus annuus TaxID=4232 RepID=A0A9K3HMS7_HELAN|nr:hypothetical protein HanXRQr2_Chr11g0479441 [Helianthus annuus]
MVLVKFGYVKTKEVIRNNLYICITLNENSIYSNLLSLIQLANPHCFNDGLINVLMDQNLEHVY